MALDCFSNQTRIKMIKNYYLTTHKELRQHECEGRRVVEWAGMNGYVISVNTKFERPIMIGQRPIALGNHGSLGTPGRSRSIS